MTKYTTIALFVLILCILPGQSYAWFFSSDDPGNPGFASPSAESDIPSKLYGLHYHDSENSTDEGGSGISHDSGMSGIVFPVRINIDIPLSLLSKEAIDPEESLDRLVAANLRLQNILDEYLALKKRNELLLKDLRIPYLEKRENRTEPSSGIAGRDLEAEKLRTDIENMIHHGVGYTSLRGEQDNLSDTVWQTKGTETGGEMSLQEGAVTPGLTPDSENYQRLPGKSMGTGSGTELPWIFQMTLDIFGYMMNNKAELLVWSMVGFLSILIVTLVYKR